MHFLRKALESGYETTRFVPFAAVLASFRAADPKCYRFSLGPSCRLRFGLLPGRHWGPDLDLLLRVRQLRCRVRLSDSTRRGREHTGDIGPQRIKHGNGDVEQSAWCSTGNRIRRDAVSDSGVAKSVLVLQHRARDQRKQLCRLVTVSACIQLPAIWPRQIARGIRTDHHRTIPSYQTPGLFWALNGKRYAYALIPPGATVGDCLVVAAQPPFTAFQPCGGGGTIYYQTIQNNGTPVAQEPVLNFVSGVTCVDDAGVRTNCTASGGGGVGPGTTNYLAGFTSSTTVGSVGPWVTPTGLGVGFTDPAMITEANPRAQIVAGSNSVDGVILAHGSNGDSWGI